MSELERDGDTDRSPIRVSDADGVPEAGTSRRPYSDEMGSISVARLAWRVSQPVSYTHLTLPTKA